ncbi:MAG: CvpA family protein [Pseudomonadota bacterium]
MTGFDFVVIAIIVLSVLIGLMRGAVKEILSLAAWVLAFLAAKAFATTAAGIMPHFISNPALRYLAGFLLIFIVVMALAMLLSLLLSESLKALGLGPIDRILGVAFGFLRGVVIVTILVLIAGLTQLPKTDVWRQAAFSGAFETLAIMVKPWLPIDLVNHLHYR